MHYKHGQLEFTRVEYMSLPVPGELIGIDDEELKSLTWLSEPWLQDDQVVVSANAWFVQTEERKVVIDPVQAVDVLLRADTESEQTHQQAIQTLFADTGFSPDEVDTVLMTHIEGVGMVAKRENDEWLPFFPNAKILISDVQLEAFQESLKQASEEELNYPTTICWIALIKQGVVETFSDGEELLPGMIAEVTDQHCEGHSVFHIGGGDATFIGHLAVSPAHLGTGPCEALNQYPAESYDELHKIAADGRKLIGPLWPAPGMGCWRENQLEVA